MVIQVVAYVLFPPEVDRVLQIKFPNETTRAIVSGRVSHQCSIACHILHIH